MAVAEAAYLQAAGVIISANEYEIAMPKPLLAKTIDNPAIAITPEASFAEMGLDSASSAYFIVELEEWLGLELPPELVFDHPTITQLARYLVEQQAGTGDSDAG